MRKPKALRLLARGLVGVLGGLLAMGCPGRGERPPVARNVVLVVIDTLRQDRVGAYGYARPITPTLDRLAAAGALADGLAPSSWTRPSAGTIFTGLEPLRHQVAIKTDRIPATVPTLPELLRARGFSTVGLTTNGHVAAAWGFDRGFDQFDATWNLGLGHDTPAAEVNRALAPRLARLRPPYFLYVHYLDPHQPYAPPKGWDGRPLPPDLAALAPLAEGPNLPGGGGATRAQLEAASELYDGEVRAADAALGDLLDLLRERGLERETLVVVLSDHGEEFGEHGRVGHGKTLDAEVVRVPLVFHAPGALPPGRRLGRFPLASLVPTLLDLVAGGAPEGVGFDGPSYADALTGRGPEPPPAPRLLYLEGDPDAGLALVDGDWKLLLQLRPYRKQLFALTSDPAERVDRSATEPAVFARLAGQLAGTYNDQLRRAHERKSTTADEELSKQLAALGYGGANQPKFAKRIFPRRIVAADPRPGGPRGWENLAGFASCAPTVDDPAGQLLAGWYGPAPGEPGRWTEPEATFAVGAPPPGGRPLRLVVEGTSWRRAPCRARLTVEGGDARETTVAPGPFRLELEVAESALSGGYALARLSADPPFRPREAGLPDDRTLGLFVSRYCLEPAAP